MKILYVATIGGFMPFLKGIIRHLLDEGHEVDIATNMKKYPLPEYYKEWKCGIYQISFARFPFNKDNLKALKEIKNIVSNKSYDIVHVHTPVASVIGRIVCWLTKTKCFYTAHGFHFYKGAPLLNWLLYFPIEWLLSFVTDTLITINKEDYEFAKKHLHARRIEFIPGVGIDVEKFANTKVDRNAKRRELGIPENCKLLLSVGELNNNKNHQLVLKALAQIDDKNIHYAICGKGELQDYLLSLAKELKVSDRFHLLGRRDDIPEILKCSDIFVHPSLREGLPVSLMEALASDLPCIASDIRGCRDLIENGVNGNLIKINDSDSFCKAILENTKKHKIQKKQMDNVSIGSILEHTNRIYNEIKKTKILHVLNTSSFSGAENVACQIISMFNDNSEFEMAYCSPDGNIKNALEERKIKFLPVKSLNVFELRKVINKFKPDIIHAHDFTASLVSSLVSGSIPIINHLHNNNPWLQHINLKSISYLYAAIRAKRILTVSNSIMNEYVFGNLLRKKNQIIGNPIDNKEIIEKAKKAEIKDESDIIFLGRLSPEKNPLFFIDIIAEIVKSKPDLKVAIVGTGPLEKEVKKKCKHLLLENNIEFYDFQKNPYGLLNASKILCMPSLWEGFGLAAVEALSLGKPVVASNVGGLSTIVNDRVGMICYKKDEYINEIISLLKDDEYYKNKSLSACIYSREINNIKQYIIQLIKIYEICVSNE